MTDRAVLSVIFMSKYYPNTAQNWPKLPSRTRNRRRVSTFNTYKTIFILQPPKSRWLFLFFGPPKNYYYFCEKF